MSRLPLFYRLPGGLYNKLAGPMLANSRKQVWQVLASHLETKNQTVLLPGGGTGLDLVFLPHQNATLLDLAPKMLAKAPLDEHAGWGAVCADGEVMPLEDNSVDLIAAHLVVQIVPDGCALLRECWRVLKPGGLLSLWDKFPGGDRGIRTWLKPLSFVTRSLASGFALGLDPAMQSCPGGKVEPGAKLPTPFRHVLIRKVE